ncbi:hypothetical protein B0H13DRAFT_1976167 [Mycena leptocephala]|nr:hypothetical protein B0H13DRAFT_1976167 [Mycena leptocephala]
MPSMALDEALAAAEERRTFCQTVPSMNAYQPLATSALEVCVSATQHTRKNTSLLAVHAVKRTAALIEAGVDIPMSPERRESLERFQSALDMMRRHIESIPQSGIRIFSSLTFRRKSAHLKAELDGVYKSLLHNRKNARCSTTQHESFLGIATLGTRAAGIACDVPFLNVLKPVVGMAALICETVKVINSARLSADSGKQSRCCYRARRSCSGRHSVHRGSCVNRSRRRLEDTTAHTRRYPGIFKGAAEPSMPRRIILILRKGQGALCGA